ELLFCVLFSGLFFSRFYKIDKQRVRVSDRAFVFWMILNPNKIRVFWDFYNFNKLCLWVKSGGFQSGFFQLVAVLAVKFIAMTVTLANGCVAVNTMCQRAFF